MTLRTALLTAACLISFLGDAAVTVVGEEYFTVMLGGEATWAAIVRYGAAFTSPANVQGAPLSSADCLLRHHRVDVGKFTISPGGVSVAPQAANDSAALVSTVAGVSAQLTVTFSVRCVFPQPFDGGVPLRLSQRGTANFTWAGSLSWLHSLTVDSGWISIGASTMLTPTSLGVAYAYDDATGFLLDPFVSAWVVGKAASLSAEFQAYLDGLSSAYFAPLAQVALNALTGLESNTTCAAAVVGSKLNLTSGTTCQTGLVPDFPGLPDETIWYLQQLQTSSASVDVAETDEARRMTCVQCMESLCGFSFPKSYSVDASGQYCQLLGTGVQASVVDIASVSIA